MTASADLVVVGRIATLAGADGPGWVEAIAIRGGRVVATGRADDVEAWPVPGRAAWSSGPTRWRSPG